MLLKHCNFLLSWFYRQCTFRTRKRKTWSLEFVLTCKIHKWNFVSSYIVQEPLWNHTASELSQPINTKHNPGTRARICQECLFVGSHSAPQRSRNTCSLISCSFRLCSLISWSSCSALSSSWDTSIRACSRLRFKLCRKQNVQYIGFGFSNGCIMKIFSYTNASLAAVRHQKNGGASDGTLIKFMASAAPIWTEAARFTNTVYSASILVQISTSSHQV